MFHKWPFQKKHFPLTRAVPQDQNLALTPHLSVTELRGGLVLAKVFSCSQLMFLAPSPPQNDSFLWMLLYSCTH